MTSPRILIADDQKINRKMLRIIFEEHYEVVEAADGQEAIELIETDNQFSLLLLDLKMPKKDGFQVLDELRERQILAQLPVIVVTSSTEEDDELRAFNSGAAEIVRKPFVPEIILRRAKNLIELYESRKKLERELISAKKFDPLTGLLNRKEFLLSAADILQMETPEERKNYAFIYTNIHNFKLYNVEFGAEQGDAVLKMLAQGLLAMGNNILCSQFGQDHMVIMTRDPDDKIENDVKAVDQIFNQTYGRYGMNFKIGSFRMQVGEETVYTACEYAKLACDSIRRTSDCYCQYDEILNRKIELSSYVLQHLDEAIEKEYIKVYFQPVVRTLSGNICGMEALARWIDPKIGFLSPIDFIPTLEENRLIPKLDLYVLRRTCLFIQQQMQIGQSIVPVSFNLSRVDFEECDIFHEVERIVTEIGVPRSMINIEITETTMMNDPKKMEAEVKKFRDGGYQVWMDDFGSGYSSLNVLKDYHFDEIKLDMRFMTSFDERSKRIVRAVIDMAKGIGVQTLAEGVETREQYDFLRDIGCEKVQGYLISKPVSCDEIKTAFLTDYDHVEAAEYRHYYDVVGKVNLVTDKPLALIEWDGETFNYLYVNDEYEKEMLSTGVKDLETANQNMNLPDTGLRALFQRFCERCKAEAGEQELIYSVRDCIIRVVASCVAECGRYKTVETRVINLSGVQNESLRMMQRLDA